MVSYGEKDVKKKLEMGAVEVLLISEDVDDAKIEEFERIAIQFGTELRMISTETREGVQLKQMGKIAAINRYEVE